MDFRDVLKVYSTRFSIKSFYQYSVYVSNKPSLLKFQLKQLVWDFMKLITVNTVVDNTAPHCKSDPFSPLKLLNAQNISNRFQVTMQISLV